MKKRKRILRFLLLIIVFSAFFRAFFERLEYAVEVFAKEEGNTLLSDALQRRMIEQLSSIEEDPITLQKDDSGHITSIQIHSLLLSRLASELSLGLIEQVREFSYSDFGIPLGNLTSTSLLSGKGPHIPIRTVVIGNVSHKITSDFLQAGINQTLHQITLRYAITVKYIASMKEFSDTIYIDLPVAETLIVGQVPLVTYR